MPLWTIQIWRGYSLKCAVVRRGRARHRWCTKLGALSAFAGKAASRPDTSIQNFSMNVNATLQTEQASNINLTVPG